MDFWTLVLSNASVVIVSVGGLIGLQKKWPLLFSAAVYAGQHAGEIVQDVEKVGKALISTPAGALVAHELHAEVDRVTEDFKKSEIARLALVGLHSFGQNYASLSDTQKVALNKYVVDSVPQAWGIDPQVVTDILAEAEMAVLEFSKRGLVQAANVFTEAQRASVIAPSL